MFGLISFALTAAAVLVGFLGARAFTKDRLRYVDAVQKASAPVIAAVGAFVVALPVVALLPLVGAGTALLFGAAVGAGVSSGARDIRKRLSAG